MLRLRRRYEVVLPKDLDMMLADLLLKPDAESDRQELLVSVLYTTVVQPKSPRATAARARELLQGGSEGRRGSLGR